MTGTYDWNPMPHRVDVTCPECGALATFEFAEVVKIRLKRDVEFFQKSKLFDYRFYENWANTGIAYCPEGFGPRDPWGLVFLSGEHMSMGMDSGWFTSLEDAFRESSAWEGENTPDREVK